MFSGTIHYVKKVELEPIQEHKLDTDEEYTSRAIKVWTEEGATDLTLFGKTKEDLMVKGVSVDV